MPRKPLTPCRFPGCPAVSDGPYCPTHRREKERERGSSGSRGYDSRWRRARLVFLAKNPLCAECQRAGLITAATVVDHIIPHKGDKALFWDESNWQPLCKPCHDSKTATRDGGLGNPVRP